jgi:hypothetical protein
MSMSRLSNGFGAVAVSADPETTILPSDGTPTPRASSAAPVGVVPAGGGANGPVTT